MGKINILPSKVYNRIAAGEVVERPCSVVKELIENSIDAGATEIAIYVEKGGKQLIRVVDNGCGIEREDLHSAFLPHATSKIATAEDLEQITSLGFRGEAIASIASVSQMSITSKTENGPCYRLECRGGDIGQITEAAGEKGTDVRVEMLFFNAPVRLNFLKTDKGEETEITACISRFILNRADIAFTYYVDGEKSLQSFAGGDEEALISVYGAAVLRECIQIDAEKYGVRIRGYIGNQNFYKANKTYQSLFLNGRYIVNATISSAISNAYSSYLMKRQYPFYVLHVDMPREVVDVNVHPNKADVRFSDNKTIYGCIYSVISAVLDGNSKALEYVVDNKEDSYVAEPEQKETIPSKTVETTKEPLPKKTSKAKSISDMFDFSSLSRDFAEEPKEEVQTKNVLTQGDLAILEEAKISKSILPFPEKDDDRPYQTLSEAYEAEGRIPYTMEEFLSECDSTEAPSENENRSYSRFPYIRPAPNATGKELEDVFAENRRILAEVNKMVQQEEIDFSDYVFLGNLFGTYLLYEGCGELLFIDQHAAHESIIYHKLRENMRNQTVVLQPLLVPFEFQVNDFETQFLNEQTPALLEMGITIFEHRKYFFKVTTIPADAWMMDVHSFLHDILAKINSLRAIRVEDLVKDKLAAAACKAAIKGGRRITKTEVDELFKLLKGNMGLKCPHGRPVVMRMPQKTIEKLFKRIV